MWRRGRLRIGTRRSVCWKTLTLTLTLTLALTLTLTTLIGGYQDGGEGEPCARRCDGAARGPGEGVRRRDL